VLTTDGAGNVDWSESHGDFSNGGEAGGVNRILGNTDYFDLGFMTDNTTRIHISKDGYVGIGTTTPSNHMEVVQDQGIATITATSYRISDFNAGQFIGRAARGTKDSPSAVEADDMLASFNGRGYGATAFSDWPRGRIGISAAEKFTDSNQGAYLTLWTTPLGTTSVTERMRITSEGNVGINTTTPTEKLEVDGNAKADTVFANAFSSNSPLKLQTNKTTRIYVDDATGYVGMNVQDPSAIVDISNSNGYDQLRLRYPFTPTDTDDSSGSTGDITWDDSYIYVKTSEGWKRSALNTF
jgi:hypothetical protein